MSRPDLTTPRRVKNYLRVPSDQLGDSAEEFLTYACKAASGLIRRETHRRFTSPPVEESREYRLHGGSYVYIDELFSTAGIQVRDGGGASLIFDAELDGDGGQARGLTITLNSGAPVYAGLSGMRMPPDHADNFIREFNGTASTAPDRIVVTGLFGWSEIPEDVSFAATRAVGLWFKEEIAHYTDDAFISRGREFRPDALPPLTMAMLRGGGWFVDEGVPL